jgi:Ca2+-binding RTX toxin-like protein
MPGSERGRVQADAREGKVRRRRAGVTRLLVAAGLVAAGLGIATDKAEAAYSVNVQGGVLTVTGDGASDQLALRLAPGDANTLLIDVGDNGSADFATDRALFSQIVVNAGGGNDTVRIDEVNGRFTGGEVTTINGQSGDDVLIGGSRVETLFGGDNNDSIRPGPDNDVAFGGPGNDTFIWNAGDGNDTLEGQAGAADVLAFNGGSGSENISLFANGGRLLLFRDPAAITLDVDDVEQVALQTLAGADVVTVNPLAATDVTRVDVGVGLGDGAADTVIVDGTNGADVLGVSQSSGEARVVNGPTSVFVGQSNPALDALQVNTFAGADQVTLSSGVTSLLKLTIDGGTESDTVLPTGTGAADSVQMAAPTPPAVNISFDGGATSAQVLCETIDVQTLGGPDTIVGGSGFFAMAVGMSLVLEGGAGGDQIVGTDDADIIIGGDGDDTIRGANGDDVALMGAGNDTFIWNPGDDNDTVEGQAGTDLLAFNTANISENIDLSPNGGRLRLTRDVANVTMDADDVQRVDLQVLGGTDKITVNPLDATDVTRVDVDLAQTIGGSAGDAQPDTVIVNGTAGADVVSIDRSAGEARVVQGLVSTFVSHSEPANDTLQVNPLAGNDQVALFPGVTPLLKLTIDGGTETDTVAPTGTSGPDDVRITVPAPPAINVSMDGGLTSAPVLCEAINVQTLGGADTIMGSFGMAATGIPLTLDGGPDADQIIGSDAADLIIAGEGNDNVDGNQNADVALLGPGDDTFSWSPGEGSDTVEGQAGTDVLAFNSANVNENIDLAPNGGRLRLIRDVANIMMDVNDVERVALQVLGGTDKVTVNSLAGTDVTRVDVDLEQAIGGGAGDAQPDTVIVNGTAAGDTVGITPIGGDVRVSGLTTVFVSHSEPANDKVQVNTLLGNDEVTGTVGLVPLIKLEVDADIGEDTIQGGDGDDRLVGGDGNDIIRGKDGNDLLFGGLGTDTLNGGAGADQFSCGGPGDTLVTDGSDTIGPDC